MSRIAADPRFADRVLNDKNFSVDATCVEYAKLLRKIEEKHAARQKRQEAVYDAQQFRTVADTEPVEKESESSEADDGDAPDPSGEDALVRGAAAKVRKAQPGKGKEARRTLTMMEARPDCNLAQSDRQQHERRKHERQKKLPLEERLKKMRRT